VFFYMIYVIFLYL